MKEPLGAAPFFRPSSGSYGWFRRAAVGVLLVAMAGCASPDAADNFNKAALMALAPKSELSADLIEACKENYKLRDARRHKKFTLTVTGSEYSPDLTVRFSRPLVTIGRDDLAKNMAVYVIDRRIDPKPKFGNDTNSFGCVIIDDKQGTFDPEGEDFLTAFYVLRSRRGYKLFDSDVGYILKQTCVKAGGTEGMFGCYMPEKAAGS